MLASFFLRGCFLNGTQPPAISFSQGSFRSESLREREQLRTGDSNLPTRKAFSIEGKNQEISGREWKWGQPREGWKNFRKFVLRNFRAILFFSRNFQNFFLNGLQFKIFNNFLIFQKPYKEFFSVSTIYLWLI